MPIAISTDSTWKYQLICDRKPDERGERSADSPADPSATMFELAPLSPRDEASIEDSFITLSPHEGKGLIVSGARLSMRTIEILTRSLKGWTNFKDAAGNQVRFDTKDMDANLARIEPVHRHEISSAVMARTRVTLAESD